MNDIRQESRDEWEETGLAGMDQLPARADQVGQVC